MSMDDLQQPEEMFSRGLLSTASADWENFSTKLETQVRSYESIDEFWDDPNNRQCCANDDCSLADALTQLVMSEVDSQIEKLTANYDLVPLFTRDHTVKQGTSYGTPYLDYPEGSGGCDEVLFERFNDLVVGGSILSELYEYLDHHKIDCLVATFAFSTHESDTSTGFDDYFSVDFDYGKILVTRDEAVRLRSLLTKDLHASGFDADGEPLDDNSDTSGDADTE